jgi:hypothetical protein
MSAKAALGQDNAAGGGEKSLGEKIKEISELKNQGILTEEEFSVLSKVLAGMRALEKTKT